MAKSRTIVSYPMTDIIIIVSQTVYWMTEKMNIDPRPMPILLLKETEIETVLLLLLWKPIVIEETLLLLLY